MLIRVPNLLDAQQLAALRALLEQGQADWVDGRVTAGYQGAPLKFNQQIDEFSDTAVRCQQIVVAALERHPLFISAALPNIVYPPMFNSYGEGMAFGPHVDGSVRINPRDGTKLRTDISATLFLAEPSSYDGGVLTVEDTYGEHGVKLAAGDMVLYPATSLHHVTPVTRGVRLACFFWVQSLIRDDQQRSMLFEMDRAIQTLNQTQADETARRQLIGCYHNLVRQWSDI
jgi:PKHD-type hydroxylase